MSRRRTVDHGGNPVIVSGTEEQTFRAYRNVTLVTGKPGIKHSCTSGFLPDVVGVVLDLIGLV